MDQQLNQSSRVLKEEVVFCKKWFGIKTLSYNIGERIIENYQLAYRPMRKAQFQIDGVEIVPILKKKDKSLELIMIANFRPPIGKFCLEFPAGIVQDANFQENASRELKEETGYIAQKFIKIPEIVTYCDPWKSTEAGISYIAIINEQNPAHHHKQDLESTQNIRVIPFKIDQDLPNKVSQYAKQHQFVILGRAWALILGLTIHRFI